MRPRREAEGGAVGECGGSDQHRVRGWGAVFLGTYAPRLDEKGRIILPAKFADDLADGVVLTRGQERCIYVFGAAEFARMHDRIRQAPVASRDARNYLRVFLSGAHDETPDKQRRVTIPPALRAYA